MQNQQTESEKDVQFVHNEWLNIGCLLYYTAYITLPKKNVSIFYLINAAGVSGQSDAECEDPDTSDGKCIKGKNESNDDLPHALEGPRLRTSNKKQKIGIMCVCVYGVCVRNIYIFIYKKISFF